MDERREAIPRLAATALSLALAGSLPGLAAEEAEWPQWRGPNRDGVAVGARLPRSWPRELPLLWRAEAGPGYSTPVLAGGRVYFLERRGEDEVVRCLDGETGAEIWRSAYAAPYEPNPSARKHGPWPKSTTTVAEGRVHAFGVSGILSALDAGDGKVLWRRDLEREFSSSPTFGVAASPLVADGLVILPVGYKEARGGLMAFRAATGENAWKAVEDGPSYGSAIAADLAGVRQAICFTAKNLVGVALADGRELWRYPFEVPFDETIVTPLVWKGGVVFAGRSNGGTRAIRLRREGERCAYEEIWKRDAPVYMSSPVISGDSYFALEHGTGRLFCLRLEDGSLAWKEGDFGDYASLVLAGDKILILDSSGRLIVIEASRESYREVASYRVSEKPTYAHLVVAGSRLLARDAASVLCFELGQRAQAQGTDG